MIESLASVGPEGWPQVTAAPAMMRAVVFAGFGGPEVLHVRQVPVPPCGPDDVVVRVAAVSVGRLLDLGTRAGRNPFARFTFPHVLGAEHAGTVVAVGAAVSDRRVGDRVAIFPVVSCGECVDCREGFTEACAALEVIGVHRTGAYAEYAVSPAQNAHAVPAGVSPVDAAGLALAGAVAANQLLTVPVKPGDWLLVQGGGSSLGSLTSALAVQRGVRVIATSRSVQKRRMLIDIGVEAALDPLAADFVSAVSTLTDGRGVRAAIDDLGQPDIWVRTLEVLGTRGTLVCSGAFLADGGVHVDLMRLYLRNQRIVGVRTGNAASSRWLWEQVEGGLRPIIDRTFPVARAADAHRYMQANQNSGRVVLTVDGEHSWAG